MTRARGGHTRRALVRRHSTNVTFGRTTQNSLPSGSASTSHDSPPVCPTSTCRAPRPINLAISESRSSAVVVKSMCTRFLTVLCIEPAGMKHRPTGASTVAPTTTSFSRTDRIRQPSASAQNWASEDRSWALDCSPSGERDEGVQELPRPRRVRSHRRDSRRREIFVLAACLDRLGRQSSTAAGRPVRGRSTIGRSIEPSAPTGGGMTRVCAPGVVHLSIRADPPERSIPGWVVPLGICAASHCLPLMYPGQEMSDPCVVRVTTHSSYG